MDLISLYPISLYPVFVIVLGYVIIELIAAIS